MSRSGEVADLYLTPLQFAIIAGGTTLGVVAFSLTPAIVLREGRREVVAAVEPATRLRCSAMRDSFGWATLSVVGTLVPTAVALALGNGAPGGVAVFVYAFAFFVLPHALVAVPMATTLAPRVSPINGRRATWRRARASIDRAMRIGGSAADAGRRRHGRARVARRAALAAFGQTASQGLAPIAHTLAASAPVWWVTGSRS